MTTIHRYPRLQYHFTEHITEPRRCWHENPALALARDLELMTLADQIIEGDYMVRKTWTHSGGNCYKVRNQCTQELRSFKCAKQASQYVYGMAIDNQEMEMSE